MKHWVEFFGITMAVPISKGEQTPLVFFGVGDESSPSVVACKFIYSSLAVIWESDVLNLAELGTPVINMRHYVSGNALDPHHDQQDGVVKDTSSSSKEIAAGKVLIFGNNSSYFGSAATFGYYNIYGEVIKDGATLQSNTDTGTGDQNRVYDLGVPGGLSNLFGGLFEHSQLWEGIGLQTGLWRSTVV
jgi:hypothetical protein